MRIDQTRCVGRGNRAALWPVPRQATVDPQRFGSCGVFNVAVGSATSPARAERLAAPARTSGA